MKGIISILAGAMALSATAAAPVAPPYSAPLAGAGALDGYVVEDANHDGETWELSFINTVTISFASEAMDDWLFLPPLQLEGGKKYPFSVDVLPGNQSTAERIEAKCGGSAGSQAMTMAVMAPTDVVAGKYQQCTGVLQVPADGVYYVGIHACSDADTYGMTLRNVSVGQPIEAAAPAAPAGLSVTTHTNGELLADVSVTAPSVDLDGNPLGSLTALNLYRDGTLCHTVEAPQPGTKLSFTVEVPGVSRYDFTAKAANASGEGPGVSVNAFVGVLEPANPQSVTLARSADESNRLVLSWQPVTTDIRGNALLPEYITYRIYHTMGQGVTDPVLVADKVKGQSYDIALEQTAGDPYFERYEVVAENAGGISDFVASNPLAVGTPHSVPFIESFAIGESVMKFVNVGDLESSWEVYADDATLPAYDADGGYLAMQASFVGDRASAVSTPVDLGTLQQPMLSVYTYKLLSEGENGNRLTIRAGDKQITSVALDEIEGGEGWYEILADLSAVKGETVQFTFDGQCSKAPVIVLDKLRIDEADRVALDRVEADNTTDASAEYFDLQGRRISRPAPGSVIIRRIGSKVDKLKF